MTLVSDKRLSLFYFSRNHMFPKRIVVNVFWFVWRFEDAHRIEVVVNLINITLEGWQECLLALSVAKEFLACSRCKIKMSRLFTNLFKIRIFWRSSHCAILFFTKIILGHEFASCAEQMYRFAYILAHGTPSHSTAQSSFLSLTDNLAYHSQSKTGATYNPQLPSQ